MSPFWPGTPRKREVAGHPHGAHWDCVGPSEEALRDIIMGSFHARAIVGRACWTGPNVESGGAVMENEAVAALSQHSGVKALSVAVNGSVWTAYPVSEFSARAPATMKEVLEWDSGIEGQLALEVGKASLTAFDPFYFRHRGEIVSTGECLLSAFAYLATKAEPQTLVKEGKMYDTRGVPWIFPVPKTGADDYRIQMPVREVQKIDVFGSRGYVFSGPVIAGKKGYHDLPVVAIGKNIEGPVPGAGDDLSAAVWLQGFFEIKKGKMR